MIFEETVFAPSEVIADHHHHGATLSIVFAGGYRERLGSRTLDVQPLSAVYKPAQLAHQNEMSPSGLRALYVELPDAFLAHSASDVRLPSDAVALRGARVATIVATLSRATRDQPNGSDLCMQSCVTELLGEAARESARCTPTPRAPWLERTRDRLREEFRSPPPLEALAAEAGVHPVYLAQVFRHRFGCTVGEFARDVRLEHVARRLRGRGPISEIAADAGFADHSHMVRQFRRSTGVTPSEFRRLVG